MDPRMDFLKSVKIDFISKTLGVMGKLQIRRLL